MKNLTLTCLTLALSAFLSSPSFASNHTPKRGSSLGAFQRCVIRGAQAYPGDKDSQNSIAGDCFDHYMHSFGSFEACLNVVKQIYRGDADSQGYLRGECLDAYEEAEE